MYTIGKTSECQCSYRRHWVTKSDEHTEIEIGDGWIKGWYPLCQFIDNNFSDSEDTIEKSFKFSLVVLMVYNDEEILRI